MERKRIASSLLVGIISEIANKIFPLVTLRYATEHLGIRSFGVSQFSQFLIDLAIFFVVFGYQGWGVIAWRNAPAEERSQLFSVTVLLRLGHAFLAILALTIALNMNSSWDNYHGVVLKNSFVILTAAFDGIWAMTALNLLPVIGILSIVAKTLSLLLTFALVQSEQDAGIYTFITMAANAMISLGTFVIVLRKIGWKSPTKKQLVSAFCGALPFASSFFLLIALERFDVFIVEAFCGAAGVGANGGPLKIAQSILPVAAMATTVFFAEMLGVYEPESMMRHLRAGIRVAILIVSPIVAGVWFVDAWIVKLIVGDAFIPHARLLSIMTISILAQMFILAFGNQVLAIRGQMMWYNSALAVSVALGIGLSFAFGDSEHLQIFAITSVAARSTAAILMVIGAMKVLGNYAGISWEITRSMIPALTMAFVLYAMHSTHYILNIAVGAIIHVVVTLVLFRETTLKVLRHLLRMPQKKNP